MAWLSGFSNRLKLTIQPDHVDNTLTNFPVMINLSSASGKNNFDATAVFDELEYSQRKKIAVTTSNGTTQCPVEIEYWDNTEEDATLWAKIPTVYSSVDTDLYFYYDSTATTNSGYVGDIGDSAAQDVWDGNFVGVYHMCQAPPANNKLLRSTEVLHTGDPATAQTSFTAVNCTGLTKANGTFIVELKCDNPSNIDSGTPSTFEVTSAGTYDSEEWYHTLTAADLSKLSTSYQTFIWPMSDWGTQGGEMDVSQIDYIRWWAFAISGNVTLYWRNARIIWPDGEEHVLLDSTSNLNHGISDSSVSVGDLVDGKTGKAWNLDATSKYIGVCNSTSLQFDTGSITLEATISLNLSPSRAYWATGKLANSGNYDGFSLGLSSNGYAYSNLRAAGTNYYATGSTDLTDGNFHYISCVRNAIGMNTYQNGVLVDTNTNAATQSDVDNLEHFVIGRERSGASSEAFTGIIDEVRLSNTDRSTAWLKATYYSNWDELIAFQEEEVTTYWLTDWAKRMKLTIDHTKIDSTLIDFPIALTIVSGTTTSGIFDELYYGGPGSIDDDFAGINGELPNTDLWTKGGTATGVINNNKARLSVTAGGANSVTISSIYAVGGDFDVQIDWDKVSHNGAATLYTRLDAHTTTGTSNIMYLYYRYNGSWDFVSQSYDGGYHTENTTGVTYTSTKLRIKRVGSTWSTYKWNGSGWDTLVASSSYLSSTAPVRFTFNVESAGSYPSATIDWDNFQVISDYIVYDSGEYREKIAITTENGTTQCPVEIQQWDADSQEAILWTKVPVVYDDRDTILYLYYDVTKDDNDSYVGDTESLPARAVWDSNFVGVWHMNQDPSGGSDAIKDSTSNTNHGTSAGSMTSGDLVGGKIGNALDFEGTDDEIGVTQTDDLDLSDEITIEAIIKPTSIAGFGGFLAKGYGPTTCNYYFRQDDGVLEFYFRNSGDSANRQFETSGSAIVAGSYQYIVFKHVWGNTTSTKMYVNNSSQTGSWLAGGTEYPLENDQNLAIGSRGDTDNFNGIIDEVRLSNKMRSDAWIKATYYSNWNTLITYGEEQVRPIFLFYGYVQVEGVYAARTVHLYRRSTGELMGTVVSSSADGYFEIGSYYNDYHFVVVLPELAEDYNLLSYDKIIYSA